VPPVVNAAGAPSHGGGRSDAPRGGTLAAPPVFGYILGMENLKYPVGRFAFDKDVTPEKRRACITDIAELPVKARQAAAGLSPEQLDTPYRDGGWTVRQVVHHVADSHMNSFIRLKLALTEDNPQIKAYDQDAWAMTADAARPDIELSLRLLEGLHARWAALLSSLEPQDFARTFIHPENGPMTLDRTLQIYAWHCRHHVAHISSLRARNGW
jgi:uncharacterized damage-inducible protein DinB